MYFSLPELPLVITDVFSNDTTTYFSGKFAVKSLLSSLETSEDCQKTSLGASEDEEISGLN